MESAELCGPHSRLKPADGAISLSPLVVGAGACGANTRLTSCLASRRSPSSNARTMRRARERARFGPQKAAGVGELSPRIRPPLLSARYARVRHRMPRSRSPLGELAITHEAVLGVVREIPRGFVATYGDVADIAGFPGRARFVGYALQGLGPASDVPWHRVVNSRGELSLPEGSPARDEQLQRLASEGIEINSAGRLSLRRYRWA